MNNFKFSVSYRNNVLYERIFDADCYNPMVRQMVNIKDLVPEIRKVLQKIMSIPTQRLTNEYYVGLDKKNNPITIKIDDLRDEKLSYRFQYLKEKHKTNTSSIKDRNINKKSIENNINHINDKYMIVISLKDNSTELFYKNNIKVTEDSIIDVKAKSTIPFVKIRQIEFVEELQFDFALYLNENYIIQRKFTVFNFNPDSILSDEFIKVNNDIVNSIKKHIKKNDIDAQYLDFEIMSKHDMPFNDLKVLSQEEKKKLLKMEYSYN
jgi:chorismate mutase